ncbi:MAG: hypothetical protein H6835_13490 [Planctomycetes bacterium]|nr:hypothetical protein [Planctomycetota bacterium]
MNAAVAQWGRRAMLVMLVAAFLQPACFTVSTWQDDRTAESLAQFEPPQLEAYRATVDEAGVLLRVPATVRGLLPGVPAACEWVQLRPTRHHDTVETLVACSAVRWGLWPAMWIDLVEEVDGSRAVLLRARCGMWGRGPQLARMPGFGRGTSLYPVYSFEEPCELLPLTDEPPLGERLVACSLDHLRLHDDGTPVWGRLALTPLALVGDVLLSPFELLWWLGV